MDKNELYKIADEAKTKAGEYKKALESCYDGLKKSGRDITKEDEANLQSTKENLLVQLNRHTEIYRQIYGAQ